MANLKTTLSDPNTSFTQITPRQAPDQAREQFAQGVATVAGMAGKGYAKEKAYEQSGAGRSLEDVNAEAEQIDTQIETALSTEQDEVAGPLQESRVMEIKDNVLRQYREDDRVLRSLRDRGVLSTTEANTRRQLKLQEALSNPILAMFRNEFLDASSDMTGGSRGAASGLFQYTPEELTSMQIAEDKRKMQAAFEAQKFDIVQRSGLPEGIVEDQLRKEALGKQKLMEYEAQMADRQLRTPEFLDMTNLQENSMTRELSLTMNTLVQQNGGMGLNPTSMANMNRQLEYRYQSQIASIQAAEGIAQEAKDKSIANLKLWRTGMQEYFKAHDSAALKKDQVAFIKDSVTLKNYENFPWVFAMQQMFPDFGKLYMENAGFTEGRLEMMLGKENLELYKQDVGNIYNELGKFQAGQDADPRSIAAFNNEQLQDHLIQNSKVNKNVRANLNVAYDQATEISLKNYNQPFSMQYAMKNDDFKQEVGTAMDIARQKVDRVKGMTQNADAVIYVNSEAPSYSDVHVGRKERLTLDIPDNMMRYKDDIIQMYKTVDNHKWAWEHVADQYVNSADAFNGYLRGEWEFNTTGKRPDEGVGKVRAETPAKATELEAPRPPTAAEEEALAAQLEQRVAIRDRDRTVERAQGSPVSPIPQIPEQQAVQTTGKLSTDNMYDFTMEKEHPQGYTSKFTQLSDGSIGEGQANRDGKAYPYMFYVEGTGWEVDRGYGELIGSGLSEAEARKLVTETAPIDLKEAQGKVKEHLDKDFSEIKTKYPNMDKKQAEVLSMMAYQGAKVHKWKQTSKAITAAVKSNDPVDYMTAQAHMLNSKWATQQTPERALEVVHMFYPDTPIEVLRQMLEGFKYKRGVQT